MSWWCSAKAENWSMTPTSTSCWRSTESWSIVVRLVTSHTLKVWSVSVASTLTPHPPPAPLFLILLLRPILLLCFAADAVVRNVYYKYFHPKEALVSNGVLNRLVWVSHWSSVHLCMLHVHFHCDRCALQTNNCVKILMWNNCSNPLLSFVCTLHYSYFPCPMCFTLFLHNFFMFCNILIFLYYWILTFFKHQAGVAPPILLYALFTTIIKASDSDYIKWLLLFFFSMF